MPPGFSVGSPPFPSAPTAAPPPELQIGVLFDALRSVLFPSFARHARRIPAARTSGRSYVPRHRPPPPRNGTLLWRTGITPFFLFGSIPLSLPCNFLLIQKSTKICSFPLFFPFRREVTLRPSPLGDLGRFVLPPFFLPSTVGASWPCPCEDEGGLADLVELDPTLLGWTATSIGRSLSPTRSLGGSLFARYFCPSLTNSGENARDDHTDDFTRTLDRGSQHVPFWVEPCFPNLPEVVGGCRPAFASALVRFTAPF